MATTQSLDNFIQEQHDLLDKFRLTWLCEAEKNPKLFPVEMPLGDWDVQFAIYQDSN